MYILQVFLLRVIYTPGEDLLMDALYEGDMDKIKSILRKATIGIIGWNNKIDKRIAPRNNYLQQWNK